VDKEQSLKSDISNNENCFCDCKDLEAILAGYNNDPKRLMDILIEVQTKYGCISDEAVKVIAEAIGFSTVDVVQTLSFYHFFLFCYISIF